MSQAPSTAEHVAHLGLRLGRLMLANGAGTERVQQAVNDYVARFGYDARLMVSAEGLIITLEKGGHFHTRLGHALSGMAINMGALAELKAIRSETIAADPDFETIDRKFGDVEHAGNHYPPVLVILGMGLTAAALARLFGAEWPVVYVSVLVGIMTQTLRQTLNRCGVHPVAMAGLAAFGGGLAGALAIRLFPGVSATLCLVAAGMILVPGAPLINGIRDLFSNHIGVGVSRLVLGGITILAITFGLLSAASIAGDQMPVAGKMTLLPVPEDFLFSALAGVGFALLFNVPIRSAWVCVITAMIGHGLRTAVMHMGLDIVPAVLIGAFAATLVARLMAAAYDVPPVAFAFPGVVSMIPGSFGFRTGIGALTIMKEGAGTAPSFVAETIGLGVTTGLMTAAIAIGLSLALATRKPSPTTSRTGVRK
ncbi:threonine/serine exporter family protein [Martelella lutilitoris]|uniref:Threonine/serine exporter family protein n=1 Tax=Martelella lutilitoris TaxID=2583532 RepID=A0A5C4JRW9_9HYPH|nr:threonine/serine exporter family protein [Martelella lutilitoris]TNB48098.1 threonine/serine exporter family protein [Martelella lutilitoris]